MEQDHEPAKPSPTPRPMPPHMLSPASTRPGGPHRGGGPGGGRVNNRKVERSCVICHRRKVRCDKKLPCANCRRGGVLCCYPPGDKPAPRQPKSTIADIASRLVQLEKTLVAISSDSVPKARRESRATASEGTRSRVVADLEMDDGSAQGDDPSSNSSSVDEILVENGRSSRYINEYLLSRVLEEEEEIQSVMATPDHELDGPQDALHLQPFSLGGLIPGSFATSLGVEQLFPSTYRAVQLWNIYVNNVDSISKVLHMPTVKVEVFTAINKNYDAAPDMHCLLFAIFFAATVALSPEDALHMLGYEKNIALRYFKQGLELSLSRSNLLESPTLRSLQALGLFLLISRSINTGRALWILSGVALRAAQSIGLHRDGTNFGLSPFDCEMRRRLFWFIDSLDGRAAEDHGLVIFRRIEDQTDVQPPLNVNDTALSPDMAALPPPVQGWSEMSLTVALQIVSQAMRQLQQLLSTSAAPSEQKRSEVIAEATARVDALFADCNPVVPQQRATRVIVRIVTRKLDFISQQQWWRPTAREPRRPLSEAALRAAVEVLELNTELLGAELMRDVAWVGEAYPQYHMLLYALWHLGLSPETPSAERAWRAVEASFDQEGARRARQVVTISGAKWGVIKMMREKALRAKERVGRGEGAVGDNHGSAKGAPESDSDIQGSVNPGLETGDAMEGMADAQMGMSSWDDSFVDWNSLLEDFTGHHQL